MRLQMVSRWRRQEAMRHMQGPISTPPIVYLLTIIACLGGLLIGYNTVVVSGALVVLREDWKYIDDWWQSLIISITVGTAALFALIAGVINEAMGRRICLISSAILFLIGPIVCALALNMTILLVGRIVVGMAIGLSSATVPLYIAECSPAHTRGQLVGLFQLFITMGILLASIMDAAVCGFSDSWRIMLGASFITGLIQLIGLAFMPESPRWLASHDKTEEAKKVLLRISINAEVANSMYDSIIETIADSERETITSGICDVIPISMFRKPDTRKALLVACLLQAFAALSGINTVMYFGTSLIMHCGIADPKVALWISCIPSAVNFLMTFLGIYLIEKIGRKLLLLISVALVSASLVILGIGFSAIRMSHWNDSDTTFRPILECQNETCYSPYGWLAILGMGIYICSFAIGFGLVPWAIPVEIFPNYCRSAGNAISTCVIWLINLVVTQTFLQTAKTFSIEGVYFFYASITFVGFICFWILVPETKGNSLENLELLLRAPYTVNRRYHLRYMQDLPVTTAFVHWLTAIAVLGGFLFGYNAGVVSGAIVPLKSDWDSMTKLEESLFPSLSAGVAAIFAPISGWVNECLGRKRALIISAVLFLIGPIVSGTALDMQMLFAGRVILGMAIGFSSASVPHYIAECTPAHARGRMITFWHLILTFGFFTASFMAAAVNRLPDSTAWRVILGLPAFVGLIHLIGLWFVPESPRWLAAHGKTEEAKEVLLQITANHVVCESMYNDIMEILEETQAERRAAGNDTLLIAMFKHPYTRKAMLVAFLLQAFQSLCGINTVMYYGTSLIIASGIKDSSDALWLSCIPTAVNVIMTFLALYLIDRIGRKQLLIISVGLVTVCLFILGAAFTIVDNKSQSVIATTAGVIQNGISDRCFNASNCQQCAHLNECGFCIIGSTNTGTCMDLAERKYCENLQKEKIFSDFATGYCPSTFDWFPTLGLVLYLCSYSFGYGPVPWVTAAEIFPNYCRSAGNAMATSINWLLNLIVTLTFLQLGNVVGPQGVYFIYGGITLAGFVLFWFLVPETKGKTLERLERILKKTWSKLTSFRQTEDTSL